MAFIILMAAQKGGVGKSTLARALGLVAAKSGFKTLIADLDPQKTVVSWHERRVKTAIEPLLEVKELASVPDALNDGNDYDVLIIDYPGRMDANTLDMARVCDLLVQPSGDGVDDLDPAVRAFHLLHYKHEIPKERLVVALCRVSSGAGDAFARTYIKTAGYEVLRGAIPEKRGYKLAHDTGFTVLETDYEGLNQRANEVVEAILAKLVEATDERQPETATAGEAA